MTEHDFFCLGKFIRSDADVFHIVNNVQGQLLSCFAFLWIDRSIYAEQTWIPRRVGKCRYAKRETSLFANAPVQTRAAPLTENR